MPSTIITIRKNIEKLTNEEWNRFAAALDKLKSSGEYDKMTEHHGTAMRTPVLMAGEVRWGPTAGERNHAHAGPVFFPWHRQYLRELELKLIDIQKDLFRSSTPVGIPYWRWNASGSTWTTAPVWKRLGGNGDPANGMRVTTGSFAHWNSRIWNNPLQRYEDRPGIVRDFLIRWDRTQPASGLTSMPNWGNRNNPVYDASPWSDKNVAGATWRNDFESTHNFVHWLIDGDMMTPTSPNDPIFWLHHCNVDRGWAWWQAQNGVNNFKPGGPGSTEVGPTGHNWLDAPLFLDSSSGSTPKQISGMMDRLNFDAVGSGFTYDTINP